MVYFLTYRLVYDLTGRVLILLNLGFLTSFYMNFSLGTKYWANFWMEWKVSLMTSMGSLPRIKT